MKDDIFTCIYFIRALTQLLSKRFLVSSIPHRGSLLHTYIYIYFFFFFEYGNIIYPNSLAANILYIAVYKSVICNMNASLAISVSPLATPDRPKRAQRNWMYAIESHTVNHKTDCVWRTKLKKLLTLQYITLLQILFSYCFPFVRLYRITCVCQNIFQPAGQMLLLLRACTVFFV